jgi:hypothetical protein
MNWSIAVLPGLEQQALSNAYDNTLSNVAASNLAVLQTIVPVLTCPTDPYARTLVVPTNLSAGLGSGLATGSYKGNAGKRIGVGNPGEFFDASTDSGSVVMSGNMTLRGPLTMVYTANATGVVVNRRFSRVQAAQIRDGMSQTFLVGEAMTAASSNIGANGQTFWGSGYHYESLGTVQAAGSRAMGSSDYDRCVAAAGLNQHAQRCARAFGSTHSGDSIGFVMCDGSVHSVDGLIDAQVFQDLGSISGRENVNFP